MMSRRREEGRSEGDALIAIIGRTLQNKKHNFWLKVKELHCKKRVAISPVPNRDVTNQTLPSQE